MKRIQASMRLSCVRHCHRPLTHALPVPVEFQHQLHPLASSNSTIILHIQTKAQVDIQYKNSNTTTTTADPDRPSLHTPCSISHLAQSHRRGRTVKRTSFATTDNQRTFRWFDAADRQCWVHLLVDGLAWEMFVEKWTCEVVDTEDFDV
jgi:hypothetical protein